MNKGHIRIRVMPVDQVKSDHFMVTMVMKKAMDDGSCILVNVMGQLEILNDKDECWYSVPIVSETPEAPSPLMLPPPKSIVQ